MNTFLVAMLGTQLVVNLRLRWRLRVERPDGSVTELAVEPHDGR